MNSVRTLVMAGAVAVIRTAIGLGMTKTIAVYGGPTGIALFGQFQSFLSAVGAVASGGTGNGVVKYLAQYHDDPELRKRVFCTALALGLALSVLLTATLLLGASSIAPALFGQRGYEVVVFVVAAGVVFFSMNATLSATLNGLRLSARFFSAQVVLGLLSLSLVFALVPSYGVVGGMIALVISQVLGLAVIIFLLPSPLRIALLDIANSVNKASAIWLIRFSAMVLTTAIVVPASHIAIRDFLALNVSAQAAGYWHGLWRISEAYLLFITSALSVYYLPRLSEIEDKKQLLNEILQAAKYAVPATIICSVIIFLARDLIIRTLYTDEFSEMRDLFVFQLIGDVLKISSWLLAFLMLAKARAALYMVSEVVFSVLFVVLTIVLVNFFGLIGSAMAHAANYTLYLALMVFYAKYELGRGTSR